MTATEQLKSLRQLAKQQGKALRKTRGGKIPARSGTPKKTPLANHLRPRPNPRAGLAARAARFVAAALLPEPWRGAGRSFAEKILDIADDVDRRHEFAGQDALVIALADDIASICDNTKQIRSCVRGMAKNVLALALDKHAQRIEDAQEEAKKARLQ